VAEDQEFTLPPLEERPLVTFALFAYNQEKYIREAVEGAFAQTYEPLEIILSDDCSTDRTFEIMEEMAASYEGKHRITLNRNSANLGIGAHVNKIDGIAKGELIVHAAGDDISLSNRVTCLAAAWQSNERPSALRSNALYIDEQGNPLGTYCVPPDRPSEHLRDSDWPMDALGCSLAFDRKLLHVFGPFDPLIFQEDTVISSRALMLDGIKYINAPLLLYRRHNSVSNLITEYADAFIEHQKKWALCRIRRYHQLERDHLKIRKKEAPSRTETLQYQYNKAKLAVLTGSLFCSVLTTIKFSFKSIPASQDLCWLLLVRLGIKKNF